MADRDCGTISQCLSHKTRHHLPRHHQFVSLRCAAHLSWGIPKSNVTKDCFCYKLHWGNNQEPFESCKSLLLILIWRDTSWAGQAYKIGCGKKEVMPHSSNGCNQGCSSCHRPTSMCTAEHPKMSHSATYYSHHAFKLLSLFDYVLKQAGNKKFSYQPCAFPVAACQGGGREPTELAGELLVKHQRISLAAAEMFHTTSHHRALTANSSSGSC